MKRLTTFDKFLFTLKRNLRIFIAKLKLVEGIYEGFEKKKG